jgi:hypothetical protein
MVVLACQLGTTESARAGEKSNTIPGIDAKTAEELYMLGYAQYAEDAGDEQDGVTLLARDKVSPGYSLHVNHGLCGAQLMDVEGSVLHEWVAEPCHHWSHARLMPDGDLLVVAAEEPKDDSSQTFVDIRYVERFDWSGARRWRSAVHAHHDAVALKEGGYYALALELREIPELSGGVLVMDNMLTLMSADGDPIESISLTDTIRKAPEVMALKMPRQKQGLPWVSPIHANSIEPMTREDLIYRYHIFGLSNVLISSRNQDAIFVVDWETRKLVWAWGEQELQGPHDASVLANGNILIFDNGRRRGWSRVIELNPMTRKTVWKYQAPKKEDFYSVSRGSCQRLPNGNTLIANSNSGIAFEVTREGELVWEWKNPKRDDAGRRSTIIRMDRYPPAYVEPMLARFAKPERSAAPDR